ncbi:MAG TPA: hypothetical protein DD727_10040 [Clostridiales bacterium]|nr:hypothetical protein [Clostridiales bacterium]
MTKEKYSLPQPPVGITPADTRGWFPWNPKFNVVHGEWIPDKNTRSDRWTAKERIRYEKRIDWFYRAKYGIFFHFLAFGASSVDHNEEFSFSEGTWSSDKWNRHIESIDVEKTAQQAEEAGVGYVGISLGQNHRYACAPNPVIDEIWNLKPGQYNAIRDLPMDLGVALAKRGIPLMLYLAADNQHRLPFQEGVTDAVRKENWVQAAQWYSDHYNVLCKSWWVDGLHAVEPDPGGESYEYPFRLVQALRHGNPDTLVACSHYHLSDYIHGHCIGKQWEKQRINCKPYFGRWDPDHRIQWHAFQYLGSNWGETDTPYPLDELVTYVTDIVQWGGVFTFDVGSFQIINGDKVPSLEIPSGQLEQIYAVRDHIKNFRGISNV